MKASELIAILQLRIEQHGDLAVIGYGDEGGDGESVDIQFYREASYWSDGEWVHEQAFMLEVEE